MIDTHRSIGEIAAVEPAATRVFLRHKIDFCCGGQRTLDQACRKAGVDPAVVAGEIEAEIERGADVQAWVSRPTPEVIAHLLDRYHAGLRRDLPPLIAAARRVERVHADKPDVPTGLADHLELFWDELQLHLQKEEEILFPMFQRGSSAAMAAGPVKVMEREHDEHAINLGRIRALTHELDTPPHACATWRALYDGLRAFEEDLMQHVHLENHVLFPRASAPAG